MKSNSLATTIGERLRTLRKQKGETQSDVAKALGVRRQYISYWENDDRDIKTTNTVALANHFGVSCDYILRGIEPENAAAFRLLGLNNNSMEAIKRIWEQYPLMGNRFLDNLFDAGFETILMDLQSLYYQCIARKNSLDKHLEENPDYKELIRCRVNNVRPATQPDSGLIPGLYEMALDIDGFIDIRLQQINTLLNMMVKNVIEDSRIKAKKRASADLKKLLAEIEKRNSKKQHEQS